MLELVRRVSVWLCTVTPVFRGRDGLCCWFTCIIHPAAHEFHRHVEGDGLGSFTHRVTVMHRRVMTARVRARCLFLAVILGRHGREAHRLAFGQCLHRSREHRTGHKSQQPHQLIRWYCSVKRVGSRLSWVVRGCESHVACSS